MEAKEGDSLYKADGRRYIAIEGDISHVPMYVIKKF